MRFRSGEDLNNNKLRPTYDLTVKILVVRRLFETLRTDRRFSLWLNEGTRASDALLSHHTLRNNTLMANIFCTANFVYVKLKAMLQMPLGAQRFSIWPTRGHESSIKPN